MRPHKIAVLALDQVVGFDLAIPCQVFGAAQLADGTCPYEVLVCGGREPVAATAGKTEHYRVQAPYELASAATADTMIVPGLVAPFRTPPDVVALLRAAAARGTRIAAICTGAFALAEAGLLAGRRATTHWLFAGELARRYPTLIVVETDLYAGDGQIFTSAGVAAGLDLCVHLIDRDHGASVAAAAARFVVMAPARDGGHGQLMSNPPATDTTSLADTLDWMRCNLAQPLRLRDIANHAAMSVRSLSRRFVAQTGETPLGWLRGLRLRRARELLETSTVPITKVAELSGYASDAALRTHFAQEWA